MPLQLLPFEESDHDAYEDIIWEAFKDDLMGLMYPNGFTQAARNWGRENRLKQLREHPEKTKMFKVIDTELPDDAPYGKIVGVSSWEFTTEERTEEELDAQLAERNERGLPPDCNAAMLEAFFGTIRKCKREIIGGQPHANLGMLATLPDHHRRGIGAMHLNWGLGEADKLGLPAYLEASPKGKLLYARMGFEELRPLPFDPREYGAEQDLIHTCMLRKARVENREAQ